jgi:cytochrome c biogenesis protein CcmG, thiol:disulfide interchange protein DsbE
MRKAVTMAMLLLLNASFTTGGQKQIWAKSFLNQQAPELVVEKWLTKEPDRKGKFLLVDFWATWCVPCRRAIPELNGLQQQFPEKLLVVGLSTEPEEVVRKMTNPAINYSVAIDTKQRMIRELDVRGIPHVILVDPRGIVRWEGHPLLAGHELTESVVKDILDRFSPLTPCTVRRGVII